MRLYPILLFVALLSACQKEDIRPIENLNNGKFYVIGHAGEGFTSYKNPYPFNSEGSISRAIQFHLADGVEVDVQLSKDHKNILYHDDYLDTKTHCSGSVYEHKYEHLTQCQYADGVYSSLFFKEYLIDLNRVFAICMKMPDPKPICVCGSQTKSYSSAN